MTTAAIRTLAITGGQEFRRKPNIFLSPDLLTSCSSSPALESPIRG
jgi:hypothetical protein